jgi:uncharacterized protein YqgQ
MEKFPIDKSIIKMVKKKGFWKTLHIFKHYNCNKLKLKYFYMGFKANKGSYTLFYEVRPLLKKYDIIRIQRDKDGEREIILTEMGQEILNILRILQKDLTDAKENRFKERL